MRIGVVSDTHSRPVPKQLWQDFKDVDLIIHAGDFCTLEDWEQFRKVKEVKAVLGNMDEHKLARVLAESQIIEWEGFKIGVYHGRGPANSVLDVVKDYFKRKDVDAVIFGHSHCPFNEVIDGVLYFNPGSPNDTIFAPYCSYGFLEKKNEKLVGRIVKVEK